MMPTPVIGQPCRMQHAVLLMAAALAACSTLTPQVFSDQLLEASPPGTTGTLAPAATATYSVADALREAEQVQRKYVRAVDDLSNVSAGSSALLIALSALGLYKGVTDPAASNLAAIGIAGGATYAYATTMTSRPRQLLFLGGADALNCAAAATRPYVLPKGWLRGDDPPHPAADTIEDLADLAEAQTIDLGLKRLELAPHERIATTIETTGAQAPKGCPALVPRQCPDPPPGDADRRRLHAICLAQRSQADTRCAGPSTREVRILPHPDVAVAVQRMARARRLLDALAKTGRQQAAVFGAAGDALHARTVAVQIAVAREVLKTEPDATAAMSAVAGLRGTAFSVTGGAAVFKPAEPASAPADGTKVAKAQSDLKAKGTPPMQERIAERLADGSLDRALVAADRASATAEQLALRLQSRLEAMKARVRASQQQLDRCSAGPPGARLVVVPDGDELTVAPGTSKTFVVSGGSGTPTGRVAGDLDPKVGELTRRLDGTFEFKAAAGAPEGSAVALHFSDGAGALTHDVKLTITTGDANSGSSLGAASTAPIDAATLDPKLLGPLLGLPASPPPNDKQVVQAIETCLRARFGIAAPDAHRLDVESYTRILQGKCLG